SVALSFATTYALGQVAKRYYAGGRTMSTDLLKQTYAETLGSAKQMQSDFGPQIQQRASNLNMNEVMSMVRN
ncbi:MAG: GTPase, partial [Pseudomonadota bacterium]